MTNRERIGMGRQSACPKDVDLDELMEVVSELIEVMRQENDFLRAGMPAALSELGARKEALTRKLIERGRFGGAEGGPDANETASRRHLLAAGNALKDLTRENMLLLEGAMSASRRRIESVMRAIHAHEGRANGSPSLDFRVSTVKFDV